jgi:tetratricopeptide (TPR) repeat protein
MLLKEWGAVANVLEGFRELYPKHDLQADITKKLAVVYQENGEYLKAAAEFERIEKENPKDNTLRREALNQAAELYVKSNEKNKALLVYTKLVDYFPTPIEDAIEARQKMADIYLEQDKRKQYVYQLKQIVAGDAVAGKGRTDRTKYLAANAALILTESKLTSFKNVALVKPFKKNLKKKKQKMRTAIEAYTGLVDYQVGEVTAAATYYIAEIYYDFSISLIESERPTNLSADELEEYELVIEDQAYPFEEKAISVHEKNMELLDVGIYNEWIDKSIIKLSVLLPARYAKTEQPDAVLGTIQNSIVLKEDQKKLDSIENKSLTNDSDVGSSNDAVERDGIVDKDSAATEKFISASNVVNNELESKHLENKSLGATND